MAHIGTLRDFRFNDDKSDVDDIRGSNLYGRDDDKLGKIDDVIFDHTSGAIQYVVVDTGGWMSSKQFMVPAERISQRPGHDDDFYIDLNKEQVQRFPEYNENVTQDENRWRDYESRYRAKWDETGGVLHKEGSVNIITPEPDEMPAASGTGTSSGIDATPTRLAGKFPDPGPDSNKIQMRPSGTAADAEDSRLPGAARGTRDFEVGDELRDERGNRDDRTSYGNVERTVVPASNTRDLPEAYRNGADESLNPSDDLSRPYPVQQGRGERWKSFEERLRQHRHEATSSCNVCKIDRKDRAA
jgi:hypothetical protein